MKQLYIGQAKAVTTKVFQGAFLILMLPSGDAHEVVTIDGPMAKYVWKSLEI